MCCNPFLVVRSAASGSLQMCISTVLYHLYFFFKLSYISLTLIPFYKELNIKSIISSDLNMQFNVHVLAVLVGSQSMGAG